MANGSLYSILHNDIDKRDNLLTTEGDIINIACDISYGMEYLHSRENPIIHRDLNTKNVLLDEHLVAKIADFGLSKIKFQNETVSHTFGAVAYMAPEILSSKSEYNTKADVYSFGIILWELYTGLDPTPNINSVALANMIIEGRHELHKINDDCPKEWRQIIEKCKEHDPNDRPSFDQISKELAILKLVRERYPHHWYKKK